MQPEISTHNICLRLLELVFIWNNYSDTFDCYSSERLFSFAQLLAGHSTGALLRLDGICNNLESGQTQIGVKVGNFSKMG